MSILRGPSLETRDFSHLTSYAGRRNDDPRYRLGDAEDFQGEPVLACLCHDEGVLVAYGSGATRFHSWADLGVLSDEEPLVGEGAKSPLLRKLAR